jgi:hypothetical protein
MKIKIGPIIKENKELVVSIVTIIAILFIGFRQSVIMEKQTNIMENQKVIDEEQKNIMERIYISGLRCAITPPNEFTPGKCEILEIKVENIHQPGTECKIEIVSILGQFIVGQSKIGSPCNFKNKEPKQNEKISGNDTKTFEFSLKIIDEYFEKKEGELLFFIVLVHDEDKNYKVAEKLFVYELKIENGKKIYVLKM